MPVIHGVSAVAELKLVILLDEGGPVLGHPRRQCRGRIEAGSAPLRRQQRRQVIHGVSAVAELKHSGRRVMSRKNAYVIHGVSAVAELKHRPDGSGGRRRGRSSTASVPWPN